MYICQNITQFLKLCLSRGVTVNKVAFKTDVNVYKWYIFQQDAEIQQYDQNEVMLTTAAS